MGKHRALFLGLFLLLISVDWSLAESQVNENGNGGKDPALNGTKKGDVEASPSNDDEGFNPIVGSEEKKNVGGNDGRNDGVNKNYSGAQARLKGIGDEEGSVDQCDPSAKCKIEKMKFVACLRGTGNESPEFSLLVRNNGEKTLEITITGPEFVHMENKIVKVNGKNKQEVKMKVETNSGGGNNLISLQVGKETCNLNIAELVARISGKEVDGYRKFSAINSLSKSPTITVISFAALLLLASAWTCISLRTKLLAKNGSKYQRIESELPISATRQSEPASNDGWDNSWGDDWDDEEAPLTPSVQITPIFSSKGFASRRLNKDGWKD